VNYVDLSGASDTEAALAEAANRAQTGFDLEAGPLLRLVHFALPSEDRLLAVIHHLVVDAVSWRILLKDFGTALAGEPLPPVPGSFLQWCEEVAADDANDTEFGGATQNPFDTYGNVASLSRRLDASETEDLLREAGAAYNTGAEELLLAALACALPQWSGEPENPILLESHGREGFDRLDLSRTVGWFTRICPTLLVCEEPVDLAYTVKRTKETLRRVPRPSPGARRASIRFNYLGNPRGNPAAKDALAVSTDGVGITVSPAALRPVPLELSAVVAEGQLEFSAAYGRLRFEENHVSRLLTLWGDRLRDVIRHCCGREAEVTPSDLTFGDFSLEEFDRMLQ
jgi:non-ribosomal peptide synthase protein (TIGR01720 family)